MLYVVNFYTDGNKSKNLYFLSENKNKNHIIIPIIILFSAGQLIHIYSNVALSMEL